MAAAPRPDARAGPAFQARSMALISGLALIARLISLPVSTERNMPPDAAHFLNIARCFKNGEGFSNPSAWPAWMKPDRLPMPETFKEPGYPFLIAGLWRARLDPFRAGQALSLIAGLLLPIVVYKLARRLDSDPGAALWAALLAAASPLLIAKSVSVLVESLFALAIASMFLAALWRPDEETRERPLAADLLTGALFGAAWLLRAQTLIALPPALLLLTARRSRSRASLGVVVAAIAALIVLSPFIARNLRLFGVPFYSDVTVFGIWPYVDHMTFSHGLERPPAPIPFALAHVREVLAHMIWSLHHFTLGTLPREVLGNPLWLLAFAGGLWVTFARWRAWLFAYVYLGTTVFFISGVHWDSYYFTSTVACWCVISGAGIAAALRAAGDRPLWHRMKLRHAGFVLAALCFALEARSARLGLDNVPPQIEAARHEAAWLRARLAPDEALMVDYTSYYAWFTQRHAVHLVVGDTAAFRATVTRLNVRWAALPTSNLAAYAAYYPGGRLPALLTFDHADSSRDVTVFRVADVNFAAAAVSAAGRSREAGAFCASGCEMHDPRPRVPRAGAATAAPRRIHARSLAQRVNALIDFSSGSIPATGMYPRPLRLSEIPECTAI
jgi:Dolichyl-phosphate-mannose-protein mannosyltransferase